MAKHKATENRLTAEASGLICQRCGCGITSDEPKFMESMSGSFGGFVAHWHENRDHCIAALLERIRELEKVVARQVMQLGET